MKTLEVNQRREDQEHGGKAGVVKEGRQRTSDREGDN